MMVVDMRAGEPLGTPRRLFSIGQGAGATERPYAVSSDGQHFVMVMPLEKARDAPPLTVLINWTAKLKR